MIRYQCGGSHWCDIRVNATAGSLHTLLRLCEMSIRRAAH